MNLSRILGVTLVAAFATAEANAVFFSSDNMFAPIKGSSRGASGWLIDPSAAAVNRGSGGPSAAGQAGGVLKTFDLAVGESESAGSAHRNGGYFQDYYKLTLAEDSAVSIAMEDMAAGPLFNIDDLNVFMTNAAGNLVGQAGEGESFVTSVLQKGEYTVSVTGLSQALKGGVYNTRIEALGMPIPGAAWLFGSALAAMVGMSRRRKA